MVAASQFAKSLNKSSKMLYLTPDQQQVIINHAEQTYDEECCGILLGEQRQEGGDINNYVWEVIPVQNQWQAAIATELNELAAFDPESLTKSQRYWIDPKDLLSAQRRARDLGLAIIGIYHSHPDHPAVPSECDRVCAWSEYSYVIVSVIQGTANELRSWHLDDQHQFQPEVVAEGIAQPESGGQSIQCAPAAEARPKPRTDDAGDTPGHRIFSE